jgi:hypothetical protein
VSDHEAPRSVYITEGLLEVLLERASTAEPGAVTLTLGSTSAAELEGEVDFPADRPVLTDFYHPGVGEAVNRVFGMDLGRPPKTTAARFVSHPTGELTLTREDHLAATVIVAVPPWSETDVAAFTRRGTRLPIVTLDAVPPERTLE